MIRLATTTLTPSSFTRLYLSPAQRSIRSKQPFKTYGLNDPPESDTRNKWKWEDSVDAIASQGMLLSVLLCGSQSFFCDLRFSEFPYFTALACLSVYIGSHRALSAPQQEPITFTQSLFAPVIASVFLFGLYFVIKNFPGFRLQTLIDIQLSIIGTVAVAQFLEPFLKKLQFLSSLEWKPPTWLLHDSNEEQITITGPTILAMCISIPILLLDIFGGHQNFALNNFLACCLAIEVLRSINMKSFKTASILLIGLLIYDVFWVFFSQAVVGDNVMLTVATSEAIEGPFKLLMPKASSGAAYPYSILGLGDVAIPGILAAVLLKFDISKLSLKDENGFAYAYQSESPESDFFKSRLYFIPTMFAYFTGLLLSFVANSVTKVGQPALLYIVPCMLGTSLFISASRQEFRQLVDHIFKPKGNL